MDIIESHFELGNRHPWEIARASTVLKLINNSIAHPRLILDFGSGDAWLANYLSHKLPGVKIICFDIFYSAELISKLCGLYNNDSLTFVQSYNQIEKSQEIIDLVLFADVLEHIENPGETIRGLLSQPAVTSSTKVLVTVPAFNSLFTAHDIEMKHFKRYTASTLNGLLKKEGIITLKTGYFFTGLLLPRAAAKTREFLLGRKQKSGLKKSLNDKSLISKAAIKLLNYDASLNLLLNNAGIRLPGLSVYALGQTPKFRPNP